MSEYVVRDFGDFVDRTYPPVNYVVHPWLPERGLAMIAGYRAVGKTFFSLSVAYAVATGGRVLGWQAEPHSLLYVDGEMDPAELQERLRQLDKAARRDGNGNPDLAKKNFHLLSHADQEDGIKDLADPTGFGRSNIVNSLGNLTVLWLDNLSSLCRSGIENDAESWVVMQTWLLKLRRMNKTVVMVHHTGKPDSSGKFHQRGTSKREDILNTSILLTPKKDGFSVEFTKNRGFQYPPEFDVRIEISNDECRLRRLGEDEADQQDRENINKLAAEGYSQREIARKLNLSKSEVNRKIEDRYRAKPGTKVRSLIEDAEEGPG